jgi:hypothetical protein
MDTVPTEAGHVAQAVRAATYRTQGACLRTQDNRKGRPEWIWPSWGLSSGSLFLPLHFL